MWGPHSFVAPTNISGRIRTFRGRPRWVSRADATLPGALVGEGTFLREAFVRLGPREKNNELGGVLACPENGFRRRSHRVFVRRLSYDPGGMPLNHREEI